MSYIRPLLEYSSILWDGTSVRNIDAPKKLQNEADLVLALSPVFCRSRSLENLYKEYGWVSLTDRRQAIFGLICFKII